MILNIVPVWCIYQQLAIKKASCFFCYKVIENFIIALYSTGTYFVNVLIIFTFVLQVLIPTYRGLIYFIRQISCFMYILLLCYNRYSIIYLYLKD